MRGVLGKRVVIKTGSSLIIRPDGEANTDWIDTYLADAARLVSRGHELIFVTSGAVALGRGMLGLPPACRLDQKQALAALGQPLLMQELSRVAERHDLRLAQNLITLDDTENRRRWLNARATISQLLAWNVIPVINENDTVATEEIRYGDNDRLAARVAQMMGAESLVLLSDVDGLYSADPRLSEDAVHIPEVDRITPDLLERGGAPNMQAGTGSGGMHTKLLAARIAQSAGCETWITRGDGTTPLSGLAAGRRCTVVRATEARDTARRNWLAGHLKPEGTLMVDEGASRALKDGKSLLAVGIVSVEGPFEPGAAVAIVGPDRTMLGRGVAGYSSDEIEQIKGQKSDAIELTLGYSRRPAVIHRDDLVLDPG